METGRRRMVAAATCLGLLVTLWFVAQVLLARHAALAMYRNTLAQEAHLDRIHPGVQFIPPQSVQTGDWLQPSLAGLVALVACLLVTAALLAGGRRRWSLLPTLVPLSLFAGLHD